MSPDQHVPRAPLPPSNAQNFDHVSVALKNLRISVLPHITLINETAEFRRNNMLNIIANAEARLAAELARASADQDASNAQRAGHASSSSANKRQRSN
jgi:hypothetical protein